MRLFRFHRRRLLRATALVALLAVTVLTALWQQTSASSDPISDPIISRRVTNTASTATPAVSPSNDPASLTVVINKQRALPTDYIPVGLVVPQAATRYGAAAEQSHLRTEAATALGQLLAAARAQGYELELISGYRSASYQTSVYTNAVAASGRAIADQAVARPGYSEHQTGLAADIGRPDQLCDLDACFGDTPEGRWAATHAHEYGFIVRYPAGKDTLTGYEYEPWHLRYVGSIAGDIYAHGQILEEYFGLPYAPGY